MTREIIFDRMEREDSIRTLLVRISNYSFYGFIEYTDYMDEVIYKEPLKSNEMYTYKKRGISK